MSKEKEDFENYTYKELVRVLIHRIESLDDRERLLQRDLSRIHGLLEGKKEGGKTRRWQIATIITVIGLAVSIIVAVASHLQ